jgi:hypothetical protein
MTTHNETIDVYLEVGPKRPMVGALDWPGWCRGGANKEASEQYGISPAALQLQTGIRLGD